jgi:hypothetical protein
VSRGCVKELMEDVIEDEGYVCLLDSMFLEFEEMMHFRDKTIRRLSRLYV